MGYLLSDSSITEGFLKSVAENKKDFYRCFFIEKSNGQKRKICVPYKVLGDIQKKIYETLLKPCTHLLSDAACAFRSGWDINMAACRHTGKKKVLCLDICNFFGSITKDEVKKVFTDLCGKSDASSEVLAEICTLDQVLPQGVSTSPMLSNLVCIELDKILSYYCDMRNISYTRYADDMFFSGDFDENDIISTVTGIFKSKYHFELNHKKTRVMKNSDRQIVLGLLVNEKVRLTKGQRQKMRQAAYYIKKFGVSDYLEYIGIDQAELKSLVGKVSFLRHIEPNEDICYVYDHLHSFMVLTENFQEHY